jgi:dTDP-4-dehydrorhamnose reductase
MSIPSVTRPLLITGAAGALGRVISRLCDLRGLMHHDLTRRTLDIGAEAEVADWIDVLNPWAVVNAAGYTRIDRAEGDEARCRRTNTDGALTLARACARRQIRFLTFSSHLVFDGSTRRPYDEGAGTAPLSRYGASKADAEVLVREANARALVVRTGALFGPWDDRNFVTAALRRMASGERVMAPHDIVLSPTYSPDLAHACLDLLVDGESGLWHLSSHGAVSWAEFARAAARRAGVPGLVEHRTAAQLGWSAQRPTYSVLRSKRGSFLPDLDDALARYVVDRGRAEAVNGGELASATSRSGSCVE